MAIEGLDFKYKCNICGSMRPYDMETENRRGMCTSCNMDTNEDDVPFQYKTIEEILKNTSKRVLIEDVKIIQELTDYILTNQKICKRMGEYNKSFKFYKYLDKENTYKVFCFKDNLYAKNLIFKY